MRDHRPRLPIAGTTFLSSSAVAGVAFFLDDGMPPTIVVSLRNQRPIRHPWEQFRALVEKFRRVRARISVNLPLDVGYLWAHGLNCPVEARVLDRGEVKIIWQSYTFSLTPDDFVILADIVLLAEKAATPIVNRRLEKADLTGWPAPWQRRVDFGMAVFVALVAVDVGLFFGMLYNQRLFWDFSALTTLLAVWLATHRQWAEPIFAMFERPTDDRWVIEFGRIDTPRKTFELLLVTMLIMLYFYMFGSEMVRLFTTYVAGMP